jgi:cobalt/nickel transport protein
MTNKKIILIGLVAACALALLISPYASSWPDGLEKVAENLGFIDKATVTAHMPAPDYIFPGIRDEKLATGVAGIVGTLITFGFVYIAARLIGSRKKASSDKEEKKADASESD